MHKYNSNWDGITRKNKQEVSEARDPFPNGFKKGEMLWIPGMNKRGQLIRWNAAKNVVGGMFTLVLPDKSEKQFNAQDIFKANGTKLLMKKEEVEIESYGNPFTPRVPGTFAAPNFKGGLKAGDKVKVPHKGKMVSGKIVRFDSGGTDKARQHGGGYVVDVGEPASILVPKEKVQKEEAVIADAGEQSLTEEVLSMKHFTEMGDLAKDIMTYAKDLKGGKKNLGGFTPEQATLYQIAGTLHQAHQQQRDFLQGLIYSLEAVHKKTSAPSKHGNMEILNDLSTVIRELKKYQK